MPVRPGHRGGAERDPSHYLTPGGARKLTEELQRLLYRERPKTVEDVAIAAAHGDRSENAEYKYGKKRLREIDGRIRFLQKRLESAVVVDPDTQHGEVVFFGATVEVAYEDGSKRRYQLVGEDESDPTAGRISYTSPIGRALLKKRVGEIVAVRRPAGDIELEITAITWGEAAPEIP